MDSEDFQLPPGEGVEMKYHMQKGAGMVYGWKADGKLAFEFHGEPDQKPNKDYFESYELDDKVGKDASYGSFTAPSTGIHGWFWQNKGKKDVMFHLTVAGFFDSAKMFAAQGIHRRTCLWRMLNKGQLLVGYRIPENPSVC